MAGRDTPFLPPDMPYRHVTEEVGDYPLRLPHARRWWIAFGVALVLLGSFVVSLGYLLWRGVGIWGNNIPSSWGFPIQNYVFWLGMGHAGTLISALLLLLGAEWRNSLNRFAEAMTLCAVTCAGIYPVIHLGRPWFVYWMFPYPNSMGVWPQFRSPLFWDVFAVVAYLTVSLLFWFIGLVPDLATMRDRARTRGWQLFYGILALGWRGSAAHWVQWSRAYRICAAVAVPLVVSVSSEYTFLFAAGTLPGWHSTVGPPYYVMGAVYSGFAIVMVISVALRWMLQVEDLVTRRHLDKLALVLLATGLMTAYGYVFEVFDAYYSGEADEIRKILERFAGEYAPIYWGAVFCNFVPLQLLWFRAVRQNLLALLLIGASGVVGMWLERFIIVMGTLYHDFLVSSFRTYTPTFWDWSTFFGTVGLFLTLFLLLVRFFPMISMFEEKEVLHREKEPGHG
jgi:molybdopterin-containing oxidoreductase family membrane subunit